MTTLRELDMQLQAEARALGVRVSPRQTNHEGVLIDELLRAPQSAAGVVLNAAAYAHTSLAIADAIRAIAIPVVEVHLTNTAAREPERRVAVVGAACRGRVEGFGVTSYLLGLRALAELVAAR
jgi:3-dehydroquinate dehydratase II